jgi:hypothetical protein
MTTRSKEYYPRLASKNHLKLPRVMNGEQYALGEPGVTLPTYAADSPAMRGRREPIQEDYQAALYEVENFVRALTRTEYPELPIDQEATSLIGRRRNFGGILGVLLPAASRRQGSLTDFRLEMLSPDEVPQTNRTHFSNAARSHSRRLPGTEVYLLGTAKHVISGKPPVHTGAIIEVSGQGIPDPAIVAPEVGFLALIDGVSRISKQCGSTNPLLDSARFEHPAGPRIEDLPRIIPDPRQN